MVTPSLHKDSANHESPTGRKIFLILLRVAWLALAALLIALFIAGLGPRIHELSTVCVGDACPLLAPTPADASVITVAGFTLTQFAYLHMTFEVVVSILMLAFATVIFVARFDDWFAIMVSFTILLFGLNFMVEADNAFIRLHPAWITPFDLLVAVTATLFTLLLYLFPDGRFTPRATQYAAALLLAVGVVDALFGSAGRTNNTFGPLMTLLYMGSLVLGLGAQIYRYRRVSTPAARQQTKWVLYGFALLVLVMLTYSVFVELLPPASARTRVLFNTAGFAMMVPFILLFPLSMMFSILRYRLWDIDIVINRTLVYGSLTALLVLLFVASVTMLQTLFLRLAGQDSQAAVVLSTLLITATFNPLRRRLQRLIDRRFYRRRYNAQRVLEQFALAARKEVDLGALEVYLTTVVRETMLPESVSIWFNRPQE
jgi:hypothetical protein